VGLTTIDWQFTDSCLDGEDIQVRYFDVTNGGFWPSDPGQVYVFHPGLSGHDYLSCTVGAKICYGANQPAHGLYWGVDIDNSEPCTDCCATCGAGNVSQTLTCN
jgi:hypothetical protein